MHSHIRVAVIGAGDWAQLYHFPSLKKLEREMSLEIKGVWNRTRERAEQAVRVFGFGRVYNTIEEAIDDEEVDCFVILLHSTAMYDVMTKLAPRHLPIFTEKPPGSSYLEARHLAEIVSVPNVVAFNRRYMPISQHFKKLVDEVESPYFAECQFYRSERFIEHFIMETGIHGINFMEHICGSICKIRTEKRAIPSGKTNLWICQVSFESGIQGIMKFFPSSGSSVERYEFHGEARSIYLHCPQTYTSDHPGKIFIHEGGKLVSIISNNENNQIVAAGFLDEYRDFFQAMREKSETLSNFRNAANTIRVAEAIEMVSGHGKEIIFDNVEDTRSKRV